MCCVVMRNTIKYHHRGKKIVRYLLLICNFVYEWPHQTLKTKGSSYPKNTKDDNLQTIALVRRYSYGRSVGAPANVTSVAQHRRAARRCQRRRRRRRRRGAGSDATGWLMHVASDNWTIGSVSLCALVFVRKLDLHEHRPLKGLAINLENLNMQCTRSPQMTVVVVITWQSYYLNSLCLQVLCTYTHSHTVHSVIFTTSKRQ